MLYISVFAVRVARRPGLEHFVRSPGMEKICPGLENFDFLWSNVDNNTTSFC